MLEIMGKGYVIEHCISFFQKENRQKTYQYYVTDLLWGIARKQGLNISERFRDLVEPQKVEGNPKKIISNIINKLGGGEES